MAMYEIYAFRNEELDRSLKVEGVSDYHERHNKHKDAQIWLDIASFYSMPSVSMIVCDSLGTKRIKNWSSRQAWSLAKKAEVADVGILTLGCLDLIAPLACPIFSPGTPLNPILPIVFFSRAGGSGRPIEQIPFNVIRVWSHQIIFCIEASRLVQFRNPEMVVLDFYRLYCSPMLIMVAGEMRWQVGIRESKALRFVYNSNIDCLATVCVAWLSYMTFAPGSLSK